MKKISLLGMLLVLGLLLSTPITIQAKKEKSEEEKQREELREVWDSYQPVETVEMSMMAMSECIGPEFCLDPGDGGGEPDPTIYDTGNILIALDSITDHVGLVVDRYEVIEAHPDNPNGGVDYRDNDWGSRYDDIKGLEVINASDTAKENAVAYAEAQYGEPYTMATTHWTTDKWYCSKLVWRAWYEQGYDIEGYILELRGTHVTPGDILDSPLTSVFYSS